MAKGLIAGMTDYSHQSFDDIIDDLKAEKLRTIEFRDGVQAHIDEVKANSYWTRIPTQFKMIINYALKHFETSISEFDDITNEMEVEVQEHHIKRLQRLSEVANEINIDIGKIWHQQYDSKDYSNSDFRIVEEIYGSTRDMAANLLDISNIAERLKDFVGKKNIKMKTNNPWISGSFYVFIAVLFIAGLAILSKTVQWYFFPIILIGGILLIMTIGILQLRNDEKISDKSFQSLVIETYKRLPLLRKMIIKEDEKS